MSVNWLNKSIQISILALLVTAQACGHEPIAPPPGASQNEIDEYQIERYKNILKLFLTDQNIPKKYISGDDVFAIQECLDELPADPDAYNDIFPNDPRRSLQIFGIRHQDEHIIISILPRAFSETKIFPDQDWETYFSKRETYFNERETYESLYQTIPNNFYICEVNVETLSVISIEEID